MTTLETAPDIHVRPTAPSSSASSAPSSPLDLHAVYLGDALGYYRALAAGALTSAELAARTGTAERYAREWLEQQAVTGSSTPTRRRTPGSAATPCPRDVAALTDVLDLGHVAPFARATIGFVKQVDHLVEAFRTGGGVSWAQLGADAREGPGRSQPAAVPRPAGPGVPAVHPGRRRRPARGGRVADVGCGLGWSSIGIALAYPDVTVDGYDIDARPSTPRAATPARRASTTGCGSTPWTPPRGRGGVRRRVRLRVHPRPARPGRCARGHAPARRRRRRRGGHGRAGGRDVHRPGRRRRAAHVRLQPDVLPGRRDGPPAVGRHGHGDAAVTLRRYAVEAGFADVEILDIANDFFRFYRLR
jgi:hypothetical protein